MSRSGLKQFASLSNVNCGDARTNEATLWGLAKDGHKAGINAGMLVSAGSGQVLADRTLPLCGAYVNSSGSFRAYKGLISHTSVFELVNLSTAGATTASDKYVLSLRFALANHFGATSSISSSGFGTMCGRISVILSNGSTPQTLYSVKTPIVGGAATTETITVSGEYAEYEKHITGSLSGALIPALGTSADARLIIQVSDFVSEGSPTLPADLPFSFSSFASTHAYIGVLGYSLKIYNEA
jgi:hypothetical protein